MSLVETFLQQLLQHLAAVIAGTTQRIWELQTQADCAVLTADLADPAYKHTEDWGPSSSSLHQLHLHTSQLCAGVWNLQRHIQAACCRSGSDHWYRLLLPVAVPALALSVLTVQHVSTCLELLPARVTVPPQSLWFAMMFARNVAKHFTALFEKTCSCCTGLRQHLLDSPSYLPSLCITLLVGAYGSLQKKEAVAWWKANTTTSSGSSSSSNSEEQQEQQEDQQQARWKLAAWQLACSRHDVLPTSHYLLLQLADCSSKALLWTATSDYDTAEEDLAVTLRACWHAANGPLSALLQRGCRSTKLVHGASAVFLSMAVLLHWAWYYLKDNPREVAENPDSYVLQNLMRSAFAFREVAGAVRWSKQQQQQQKMGQQLQRRRLRQRQRLRLRQRQPPVQDKPSGFFFGVSAYLEVLGDVLMLTQKLLTLLLPVIAAQGQPLQAVGSSGSSSSMGRQQAGRSTGKQQAGSSCTEGIPQIPYGQGMQTCLEAVLSACAHLSADHMTDFAGMQPLQQQSLSPPASRVCCVDVTPALREDAGVWAQHAADLCKVLEAYVREAARGLAVGGPSVVKEAALELADALVQLIDPRQSGLRGPLLQAAAAAGPGSREQQQLLGLLLSMVKWVGMMGPQQQGLAEEVRVAVAAAAANMLLAAHKRQAAGAGAAVTAAEGSLEAAADGDTASPDAAAAAASSSSHHTSGSSQQPAQSSAESMPPATQLTAEGVLAHVPWMGLLGCCCLQWNHQLATLPSSSTTAAAAAAQLGVLEYWDGVITEIPQHLRNVWGTAVHPVWGGESLMMPASS